MNPALVQTIFKYAAGAGIVGAWMYLVITGKVPADSILNIFMLILSALGIHTFTQQGNKINVTDTVPPANTPSEPNKQ